MRLQRQKLAAAGDAELAFPEIELRRMLQEIEAARVVSAHWPLQGQTIPQRMLALINKVVRRYLRWYINPIVDQQNAYNDVVARTLQGLVAANEELRGEVAQLRARVGELERVLRESLETREG